MQSVPSSSSPAARDPHAHVCIPRLSLDGFLGRREHHRVALELDVSLGGCDHVYVGLCENISRGGVFLATHVLREIGERVVLKVHLPGAVGCISGVGIVRWVRPFSESALMAPGMGVAFESLPEDSHRALEVLLGTSIKQIQSVGE